MNKQIKFHKHYVTNGEIKARVHYSAARLVNGLNAVTLYAKSYEDGNKLSEIMSNTYENDSDVLSDYMEKGRARVYEGTALYPEAYARATED